jgi:hypothetical protein
LCSMIKNSNSTREFLPLGRKAGTYYPQQMNTAISILRISKKT